MSYAVPLPLWENVVWMGDGGGGVVGEKGLHSNRLSNCIMWIIVGKIMINILVFLSFLSPFFPPSLSPTLLLSFLLSFLPSSFSSFLGRFMYSAHSFCPLQGGNQISAASLDNHLQSLSVVGNLHSVTSTAGLRIFMVQSILLWDDICVVKNHHIMQINTIKATGLNEANETGAQHSKLKSLTH